MNHKQKLKMARKMLSREEVSRGVSPFMSDAWMKRAESKRNKQLKQRAK